MGKIRLLIAAALAGMVLFGSTQLASAHVLKQSNGVTVVMHIAPFDDPAANELTRVEFEYGTDSGTFSLTNYAISYRLALAGKTVMSAASPPAYFGSAAESIANITFPKLGVYELTITGKPISPSAPAFQTDYLIRVDHSAGKTATMNGGGDGTLALLVGSGILLGIGFLASWQIRTGRRYARK